MNKQEMRLRLEAAIPEPSPAFGCAMRDTLAGLAEGEARRARPTSAPGKRRVLAFILAAILLLAVAAAAATLLRRDVFDVTMGDTPENAPALTQHDLARVVVGDAEIRIREAAYDGITLYIVYSIRDMTATAPFGETDEEYGVRYLTMEDYERLDALGVGWWTDNLWIDGQQVGMPNMSGGEDMPGEENGELLSYMQYRLDQEGLFLTGDNVEIAMPIGARQDRASLVITKDPYAIEKPKDGLVTFHLDCSSRDQVTLAAPNILTDGPRWSAQVSEVVYSPIQLYITLDWAIRPEAMEAYIAENGDGYYDDNGVRLWEYGALDAVGMDLMDMSLVDGDGRPVFEEMRGFYGYKGASTSTVWYTFPYLAEYPQEMYLAPQIDGSVDMSLAVRVR